MHFALPPRKSSFPPPYARASARNSLERRRRQIQYIGYLVFGILALYLLFSLLSSGNTPAQHGPISEDSTVALVTVLDESSMSDEYMSMIRKNRDDYASRHGYKVFYANTSTYAHLTQPSPSSWSLIPALRHALTRNPEIDYIWSLSPHALITNPSLSLYDHVFSNLTSLMLKDIPVVPPDSVIHTFSHLKPSQVYLILTQDMDNVAHTSFILRNTEAIPVATGRSKDNWSHYFLDAWFDPLYRAYAFQKAENHALEHIIQWHPTILAKLAIVDQKLLNSYNHYSKQSQDELMTDVPPRQHDGKWKPGDLVVNFQGCVESKERDCEKEMKDYYTKWEETISRLDGHDAVGKL